MDEIQEKIKDDISIYIQQKLNTIIPIQGGQPPAAQPMQQPQPGTIQLPGEQQA